MGKERVVAIQIDLDIVNEESYDELLTEIEKLINSKKNLECFGIGFVGDLTARYYPAPGVPD